MHDVLADLIYAAAVLSAAAFVTFLAGAPRLPGELMWIGRLGVVLGAIWAVIVVTDFTNWVLK